MSRFIRRLWNRLFRRNRLIKNYEEDDFEVLSFLSKGAFADVYLCRLKATRELLAMKVTDIKDSSDQSDMEANIMLQIRHPFVMSAKYSFKTQEQHFLIMPFAVGGDLSYHLRDGGVFDEETSIFYCGEIACAIGYLHRVNIVHRDIKLENVMVTETGHVKLTDFGVSRANMPYGSLSKGCHGTPLYMAPEMLGETDYGHAVDWFAFGVIIYRMMLGVMPFPQAKLIATTPVQLDSAHISADAKDIITALLDENPSSRLGGGPRDIKEIKTHPFFKTFKFMRLNTPPFIPEVVSDIDTRYFPRSAVVE